ncbi:MAG: FAD-dependent oxidoreductase [Cyclobacteriaceae bacterium]
MSNETQTSQAKYIIVGAGLSGLTCAYQLLKAGQTNFLILESRDRTGGRILTKEGVDFGATWFQEHHHYMHQLCDELGVERFAQYSKGQNTLVYSSMAPAHLFENDPSATPASRIVSGTSALIDALSKKLSGKVRLNTKVLSVAETADGLKVETSTGTYIGAKIVITIPPLIATRIAFTPTLPESLTSAMEKTHTWMSNAIKVGLTFEKPFWRSKNLSGMIIGQVGPVTELYNHSDFEDKRYALMGFVNEALRELTPTERKERITDYLSKHLGAEVLDYLSYEEKDWSDDWHTSCESIKSLYLSPKYGNPIFQKAYLNGKMLFAGAETAPTYGGYMDGAIESGLITAGKLTR